MTILISVCVCMCVCVCVCRYCTKEGNFSTNLDRKSLCPVNCWQEARACARLGDMQTALTHLETSPQGALMLTLHGKAIRKELKKLLPPQPVAPSPLLRPLSEFQMPAWDRTLTLVLHGRSNVGKTSLAVSLIPSALVVNELDALRSFNPKKHTGIIFDDMPLPNNRELQLSLIDTSKDTQVKVRYKNVKIPAGTPRVFGTNWEPANYFMQVPEVLRRIVTWYSNQQGVFIPG